MSAVLSNTGLLMDHPDRARREWGGKETVPAGGWALDVELDIATKVEVEFMMSFHGQNIWWLPRSTMNARLDTNWVHPENQRLSHWYANFRPNSSKAIFGSQVGWDLGHLHCRLLRMSTSPWWVGTLRSGIERPDQGQFESVIGTIRVNESKGRICFGSGTSSGNGYIAASVWSVPA